MASILSSAFGMNKRESITHNGVFVRDQLMPVMLKLQKETRVRRYKEVHSIIKESILALSEFETVEWPPHRATETNTADGTETTVTSDGTSEEYDRSNQNNNNDSNHQSSRDDDDPLTREPVHDAIVTTLEAFIAVLGHPAKVAAPMEYSLDGIALLVNNLYVSGRAGGRGDDSGSNPSVVEHAKQEGKQPPPASVLHRLMESMAKCCDSTTETVQGKLIKSMTDIITSPKCGVHESSLLLALRSTFHVYLVSKSTTVQDAAKTALTDMLRSVMARMEAKEALARKSLRTSTTSQAQSDSENEGDNSQQGETSSADANFADGFVSQYHADSYVLFRSLCKMSSKELDAENASDTPSAYRGIFNLQSPQSDPMSLNGKILSLELILTTINFGGDAFCSSPRFVYLVQHYLCNSLLKNCMSNHTQIAFLSQKIFLVLLYKFKGHMKQEIEIFMSNVFFRVLESPNSSFKQKALVLESLRSLCKDPVLLTQTFLNYDCDFEAQNLYKETVHMLTKLGAKATSLPSSASQNTKEAEQEAELSLAGLEVLTTILKAFLKALGLPGGSDDDNDNDTAGARIRSMLQLNIGLAAQEEPKDRNSRHKNAESVSESDELSQSSGADNTGEDAASSANAAGRIVDAFELKRNQEQNFEIGVVKFTLSLKSGLNFFIDNGFVERDAKSIASFFLANKDRLDKTQIGEALGREPDAAFVKGGDVDVEHGGPGFWVQILHHYVDALDFTGLAFDEGIRLFLSGFRLPGEAQKIDRIMEKFAQCYTTQNPDTFSSADTAFILAFSVIMLQTDLHNPSIKPERRMTVESFIRNNGGIGENGSDLPKQFLIDIYNRIKQKPFTLKEDDGARERAGAQKQVFEASVFFENSVFGGNAEEKRRERFKHEKDEIMFVTKQLAQKRSHKNRKASTGKKSTLADSVAPADVIKPMFDVTWGPILGILSQVLECSDDETCVAVCLSGFVYAVRVAAHSNMSLARDTFISSLAKFTFLGSVKEMKVKNIESIRTLLSIAVVDGEYLGESWGPVLQCISQIVRLRLTASGLDTDESFLTDNQKTKKKPPPTPAQFELFRAQPSRSELARETEENNAHAIHEAVEEVLIDKVFSSTINLSATSLAHFIEQLISVSSSELAGNSKSGITGVDSSGKNGETSPSNSNSGDGPSIFSLQKLVEVADYNMDIRPRLVWAQVWDMMADYFTKIACDKNWKVGVFAIDSLKQLGAKFLEKPELSEFNFQRKFLRPFLIVMENKSSSEDIRELVLHCQDHLIRTKSHNFRSGWKIIFSILRAAANDPSEKIGSQGLSILQRLLDEHLKEVCRLSDSAESPDGVDDLSNANRNSNVDDFVDLCRASLSFVRQQEGSDSPRPIGLSMRAFSHTAIYADLLASRRILPPVSGAQSDDPLASGFTYSGLSEAEGLEMALWRPLFEGLADGVRSSAVSSVGGVGCLLQRSSILAFRAILLRHGHLFSTHQWAAILGQTLIPAIQDGCERDTSPVIQITSESPSISSIDFLVDAPPLPPSPADESLIAFKGLHDTPKRSLGQAEVMLEASFSDLRHGGDGDLRKAYALAKKASESVFKGEQPFPDSWIATTAPMALGLLTDIASEIVLHRGREGHKVLWPLIVDQYRTWCLGRNDRGMDGRRIRWRPCEALVRVSCREAHRFSTRLSNVTKFDPLDAAHWCSTVLALYSNLISDSVQQEKIVQRELVRSKETALNGKKEFDLFGDSLDNGIDRVSEGPVVTAYGYGTVMNKRKDVVRDVDDGKDIKVVTSVIKLGFGMLYQPTIKPDPAPNRSSEKRIPSEVSVPGAYWEAFVPELKIRCITAHLLQQSLSEIIPAILPLVSSQQQISAILMPLNNSRVVAEAAMNDVDISTAFQEALLSEWGDGVAAVNEALDSAARLSHLHGSGMFFLTQEASAANAIVRILSSMYAAPEQPEGNISTNWDRAAFAEPRLLEISAEVHRKFLESEKKDGHLVDPHVWRRKNERSGVKIALYCTCFTPVLADILKAIRSTSPANFDRNKQFFFSVSCSLIPVQSEDIRQLVSEILAIQVAPLIGVEAKL